MGTLYPALMRLEQRGLLRGTWGTTDTNRRARFYALTAAGRRQLAREREAWDRMAAIIHTLLRGDADPAMRKLREWGQRLLASLQPRRSDEDLEEELRLHMDLAAEEARRRGHPSTAADRAARLKVGGIPQAMAALRDQRGLPILSGMRQDLRLSLRALRATPMVTAVVIVSLALAIGANTAIFSLVNSLLLRALPVREPERLVLVTDSVLTASGGNTRPRVERSAVGADSSAAAAVSVGGGLVLRPVQSVRWRRDAVCRRNVGQRFVLRRAGRTSLARPHPLVFG